MIIKVFFRNYYRNYAKFDIDFLERRELAFQLFDGAMIRHKTFRTIEELKNFVIEKTPRHIYHSVAYYERPEEDDMDRKQWLGADLVFDIDGDHLDTENCRESRLISIKCLDDAREEANKLIDILNLELGLKPTRVVFSGNRGFHIHIADKEVYTLGAKERRELVNYIKAVGFDSRYYIYKSGRKIIKLYEEVAEGNLIRVRMGVDNPKFVKVEIDEVVTQDVHRLIRMPGSINGKTGLASLLLNIQDLDKDIEHIIENAIVFKKGNLKFKFEKPIADYVLFEKVNGREGEIKTLPAYLAIYLELQEFGKIYD
ncbi:MAG: DNA primase catalytic subunit PriS [Pyrobaculum sp.]